MVGVNALIDYVMSQDISSWNEITLKKYIETKQCQKETSKRL